MPKKRPLDTRIAEAEVKLQRLKQERRVNVELQKLRELPTGRKSRKRGSRSNG